MAATVQNTSTAASTASVTSLSVPLPTGWAQNDVLYLFCELTGSTGAITAPGGYASPVAGFHSTASTSATHAVFRKVLTASESDPSVTCTSGRLAVVGVLVRGADTTTPEDVTSTTDTNSGGSYGNTVTPAITPATAGTLLLRGYAVRNGFSNTPASTTTYTAAGTGMTIAAQVDTRLDASSNGGMMVASKAISGTGAEASVTGTYTTSVGTSDGGSMGSAILVKSAAGGGPTQVALHSTSTEPFVKPDTTALKMYGFNTPAVFDAGGTRSQAELDQIAAKGFNCVRGVLHWDVMEPTQGALTGARWTDLSTFVTRIETAGLYTVLDIIHAWGNPNGKQNFPSWARRTNVAVDSSTDIITATAHGFVADTPLEFFADTTMPAGPTASTFYYVINPTANTFQVSATKGGSALNFTTNGTGVYVEPDTLYIIRRYGKPYLRAVATLFVNTNAVAAYDLVNEPNTWPIDQNAVLDMYQDLITDLRVGAYDANKIILIEPMYGDTNIAGSLLDWSHLTDKTNVVWSIHDYFAGGGTDSDGYDDTNGSQLGASTYLWDATHVYPNTLADEQRMIAHLDRHLTKCAEAGLPIWMGEFGAGNPDTVAANLAWTKRMHAMMTARKLGWAWWEYKTGAGNDFSAVDSGGAWRAFADFLLPGDPEPNVNYGARLTEPFRIRIELQETGGAAIAQAYQWRFSKNGGAYTLINGTTDIRTASVAGFADGDATTDLLTAGTGTFVAGAGDEDGAVASISLGASGQTEIEGAFVLAGASVAGDTFDIRLYKSDGTALATYTVTPRITAIEAPTTTTPISKSDSWTMSEGAVVIQITSARTDGWVVTEVAAPSVAQNVSDSWAVSEAPGSVTTQQAVAASETHTESEGATSISAAASAAETHTQSEGTSDISATLTAADALTLAESVPLLSQMLAASDSFGFTDTASVVTTVLQTASDSGSVTEAALIDLALAAIDSLAQAEATADLTALLSRTGAATLTDSAALANALAAADAWALAEAASNGQETQKAASDSGTFNEGSTSIAADLARSDTFGFTDLAGLAAQIAAIDPATLAEASTLAQTQQLFASDPQATTELAAIAAALSASDPATLAESSNIGVVQLKTAFDSAVLAAEDALKLVGVPGPAYKLPTSALVPIWAASAAVTATLNTVTLVPYSTDAELVPYETDAVLI